MTKLGITGHQLIPDAAREFVVDALKRKIERASPASSLWGLTSLAVGADQLFAGMVIRAGGNLHVIIPSRGYEVTFRNDGLTRYHTLLTAATKVERLDFDEPTEEAFFAAGRRIVESCEILLAVWDGEPSRGLGGTADVVEYARSSGRPVEIIWPAGVAR
jgi:hypothetical protein